MIADAPIPTAPYRERYVRSQDGLRLYVRDYGDPASPLTPILCLSGITRNSKDFAAVAAYLSAGGRRVVCPDYRGRGRSDYDHDWRRYDVPTYINDVRHIVTACHLHRLAVIGTSLGGFLAMGLAVAMPTAVAGAVLNDVGPELNAAALTPVIDYMNDNSSYADWDAVVSRLRQTFPDLPATTDAEWRTIAEATHVEDEDGRIHRDWDHRIVKPLLRRRQPVIDLWPLFRALRPFPVLALRGALSQLLSESSLARMADTASTITTVTVPGVGHAPDLTEAESRAAIDAWLDRF